jgi:hypothetical protein
LIGRVEDDLLGFGDAGAANMVRTFQEICAVPFAVFKMTFSASVACRKADYLAGGLSAITAFCSSIV